MFSIGSEPRASAAYASKTPRGHGAGAAGEDFTRSSSVSVDRYTQHFSVLLSGPTQLGSVV